MKFIKNNILVFSLPFALLFLMASCSKENIDTENTTEDPIDVEVEVVPDCGNMNITSSIVNFDGDSHAAILKNDGTCNFGSDFLYSYVVVDVDFDFQDSIDQSVFYFNNPLPGFFFISEELPQVGDEVILTYHSTSFGQGEYEFVWTAQDGNKVLLTEVGTQVGENIAGEISAEYYDVNDPSTPIPFTATFCSPITLVCD